jgi:hypothetical protein
MSRSKAQLPGELVYRLKKKWNDAHPEALVTTDHVNILLANMLCTVSGISLDVADRLRTPVLISNNPLTAQDTGSVEVVANIINDLISLDDESLAMLHSGSIVKKLLQQRTE